MNAAPKVGDSCRLWDDDDECWIPGRIDHFDAEGSYVFVRGSDGLMGETDVSRLHADAPGEWWAKDES